MDLSRFDIQECLELLKNKLECSYGLIQRLYSTNILTETEYDKIKRKEAKGFYKQNELLLKILRQKSEDDKISFLDALLNTKQGHLAAYMTQREQPSSGDRPLSETEVEPMRRNLFNLVQYIELSSGFLDQLFSRNVISERHRSAIMSTRLNDQCELLLAIIRRRSFSDFQIFLDCLRDPSIGQSHIVDILKSKNGELHGVNANIHDEGMERELLDTFRQLSENQRLELISYSQQLAGVTIIHMKAHHSIRCFFWCEIKEMITCLYELIISNRMASVLDQLFTKLLQIQKDLPHLRAKTEPSSADQKIVASIDWDKQEFNVHLLEGRTSKDAEVFSILMSCSICLENFKEPRDLPCLHRFCLQCLDQHCNSLNQYRKNPNININRVPCPMCRKFFSIPSGGNINLPRRPISDLLLQSLPTIPTTTRTDYSDVEGTNCDQHCDELSRLYCWDCKIIICNSCFVDKHSHHKVTNAKKSVDAFCAQLKEDVENLSACSETKLGKLKKLVTATESFTEHALSTENEILKKYDQLISLIQSHKSQLIEELHEYTNRRIKKVEAVKVEIERQFVTTESVKRYCQEMINKGTACDISRTAHDLHARAEELVKAQDEPDCPELSGVDITFKPYVSTRDSVKNLIGEIVFRDDAKSTMMSKVSHDVDLTTFLSKGKLLHVMPGIDQNISELTVLGSELFVVRNTSEISVYKSDDLAFERNLTITGSKQLHGLASCSFYNCLYASDPIQKRIYKQFLTNNRTSNWSVSVPLNTLSVTKNYNVLATLYASKRIQEYTTHGSLIREISLDRSIDDPRHSIQLSTGYLLVCHSGHNNHRICKVDVSGRIIQSCGGSPGSHVGELQYPRHLAIDTHDNVLVCDYSNSRLQLLSPTLTHLGDIVIPAYQLSGPYTVHFDDQSHRLYIGEYGGRVFVLEVDMGSSESTK